ncbi:hypothetical protein ACHAXT_007405 [Thalassiosira profunda]
MAASRHLRLVLAAAGVGLTQSFAAPTPRTTASTALFARHPPQDPNWTDDTKSSRNNKDVTDYLPPWRDHAGQKAFTAVSGSQATPGKSRPFKRLSSATPQENVSVVQGGVPPQDDVPLLAALADGQAPPPQQQRVAAQRAAAVPRGGNSGTLIHGIKWPLIRDPPGVSSEFPLLMTRIGVTFLSTIATWYLHLFNGFSPVLASAAMTLLVSTCLDRRLGQAAFCGSFAGMSGGHLAPTLATASLLGALTSGSYEVLIHINNFCLGIGGRLGATAFLATAALSKYRKVASVGRKMRRGLWSSGGPSSILVSMVLFHMIGAVATIFLRECSDDSAAADPVRASSVVGLLGALFMKDPTAVLALYGGSFVGMALPSRLMYGNAPGRAKTGAPQTALKLFASFAGAGALAGLIHAATMHYGYWSGGWGGKAGLCAWAGCWVYRGFGNTFDFAKKNN